MAPRLALQAAHMSLDIVMRITSRRAGRAILVIIMRFVVLIPSVDTKPHGASALWSRLLGNARELRPAACVPRDAIVQHDETIAGQRVALALRARVPGRRRVHPR